MATGGVRTRLGAALAVATMLFAHPLGAQLTFDEVRGEAVAALTSVVHLLVHARDTLGAAPEYAGGSRVPAEAVRGLGGWQRAVALRVHEGHLPLRYYREELDLASLEPLTEETARALQSAGLPVFAVRREVDHDPAMRVPFNVRVVRYPLLEGGVAAHCDYDNPYGTGSRRTCSFDDGYDLVLSLSHPIPWDGTARRIAVEVTTLTRLEGGRHEESSRMVVLERGPEGWSLHRFMGRILH